MVSGPLYLWGNVINLHHTRPCTGVPHFKKTETLLGPYSRTIYRCMVILGGWLIIIIKEPLYFIARSHVDFR